jgi:hypothetical protein
MESMTKTVEIGSGTLQVGKDDNRVLSDCPTSATLTTNQPIPAAVMTTVDIFRNLRTNILAVKKAIVARSQLAAIGIAALWHG